MAAKRGRPAGFRMSDAHRTKIANSQILKALLEHVAGKRVMKPSQVAAGLGLLKKVLPDLQSVEMTGEGGGPISLAFKTIYERQPGN